MRNFILLSLLLAILLLVLLFFWKSCCNNTKEAGCDNSINNWDHFIPKPLAQRYIDSLKARQTYHPGIHALDSTSIGVAELFVHARDMMRNMMLRDSCVGIRVYYGLKQNRIISIICGVKADGGDIYWDFPSNMGARGTTTTTTTTPGLLDVSKEEPPAMVTPSLH